MSKELLKQCRSVLKEDEHILQESQASSISDYTEFARERIGLSLDDINEQFNNVAWARLEKGKIKSQADPVCVTNKHYKGRQINWDPITMHDLKYYYEPQNDKNRMVIQKKIMEGID